jgi:hypothetical protein
MLTSAITAIEVCHRTGRDFLVLVEVNSPVNFYQIIAVPSSAVTKRLNKYLANARGARLLDEELEIYGVIYLLGSQEKSEFNGAKNALRHRIGPEGQPSLGLKISSISPKDAISVSFAHSMNNGVVSLQSKPEESYSLQNMVNRVSALKISDWLG